MNLNRIIKFLGKKYFKMIHLQNTASTLTYDVDIVTHLRTGMAIYGLRDDGFMEKKLYQVMELTTHIDSIRDITNSPYFAYRKRDNNITRIGKIKVGYAGGFLKSNEGSYCLIGNREHKILQVTMDNTSIEVDSGNHVGEKVELYHNVYTCALHNDMSIYELTTILSQRLKRVII